MPIWTNSPPDDPRGHGLPIVRTPANRSLKAIVTSDNIVGCDTHYWGGHTVPCDRPECDACNNGIAYRWHGYLTAFNPDDQLHFIFEFTAQAAATFINYLESHDTLRCCQFEAYRWRHTKNGRVIINAQNSAYSSRSLPKAPDICKVMAIIWRLPPKEVFTAGVQRGVSRIHAGSEGDGQSSDPRVYDHPQP